MFKKRTEGEGLNTNNESAGFNPSKTFGGERARMMFLKNENNDDFGDQKQGFGFGSGRNNEDKRNPSTVTPQTILPGL